MTMLRVLDLFSGIGGFSLGLERTGGFKTVAFCEIETFPRKVLAKHWPGVPIYDDIRTLTAERLAADGIGVDVICGGFPCQDISVAGKGAGIEGARSGLWSEYARLIEELRPFFALVENVPALRTRGADRVLSDLAALGYACEPIVVGALHVCAPHRRQRAWLVAHAIGNDLRDEQGRGGWASRPEPAFVVQHGREGAVADSYDDQREPSWPPGRMGWVGLADDDGASTARGAHWSAEPDVGRVAHGVPARVDRLKALGNAVVPQIPELIGRAILASEQMREAA